MGQFSHVMANRQISILTDYTERNRIGDLCLCRPVIFSSGFCLAFGARHLANHVGLELMRYFAPVLLLCLSGHALAAQQAKPLSAIDWLSQSVEAPLAAPAPAPSAKPKGNEPPVATGANVPHVTVTSLDGPSSDPVGLLSSAVTGLPRSLWAKSESATLVPLMQSERVDTLPALHDLMMTLLLAEADPPIEANTDDDLFLARVDKLLDLGALDPALELLEQVDTSSPNLFRRWFDVALLTGNENKACTQMGDIPNVAPTISARIFCTARNGDWSAAALTLNTHRVLGDVTPEEEALLSRFLDPDLYEGEPVLPKPTRLSPLVFRMREAIGEALPTERLPNAFAHSDLRNTTGWKSQLEAAERLARIGAISENVLLGHYMARTPAASGGVWERVKAIQKLDAAITAADPVDVPQRLDTAWDAMKDVKLEVPFAMLYAEKLSALPLTGNAAEIAFKLSLLSQDYESAAQTRDDGAFLTLLAEGVPAGAIDPIQTAVQAAFDGMEPSAELQALALNGQLGEAILEAIHTFNAGIAGDTSAITDALAFLRSIGLEDVARRAALQLLILERDV